MISSSIQTALVVHPHPPTRQRVRILLQSLGVETILDTGEGWEAKALMREALIDVVLTAWRTPDLEGAKLIKALRRQGRNRAVPVILLDDGLEQAAVVAAVKAGALSKVPVPAERDALREALDNLETTPARGVPGDKPGHTGGKANA